MADERSELEDILDIPEEQDHSEELAQDTGPEPDQGSGEEPPESTREGAPEAPGDAEPQNVTDDPSDASGDQAGAPAPTEMQRILAEMAELKRANSGLYSEMHSERERRKQLMDEYKRQAEADGVARERAERAASVPDKDEDPAGYLAAQQNQLVESVTERLDRMEQGRQQEMQQQVFQQAVATVNAEEERFRQERPDYDDALNYARNERARLLRATHPDQPDEWINGMISQGDRMFALQSLQQGISPAQRAYDYATRLGYAPGANGNTEQGSAGTGGAHNPAPAGSTPAPATKPKMTSLSAVTGQSGGRGRKVTFAEFSNADTDSVQGQELFDKITSDPALAQAIERDGHVWL